MPRVAFGLSAAALAGALLCAAPSPAAAQQSTSRQVATQSRPRIIIHPRSYYALPPNAKRHCVSWLAKEYRPSGPVITPQMRCWWQ